MADPHDNEPPLDPRLLKWMAERNRFAEQNEDGVDMSLIYDNLKLTPTQRIRQGYRHRRNTLQLLEIGRRNRENSARENRRSAR